MVDLCTLPMQTAPQFSSPMEMMLWLLRHQENKLVRCWWLGFEASTRGIAFERVIWEIENNQDKYVPDEATGAAR